MDDDSLSSRSLDKPDHASSAEWCNLQYLEDFSLSSCRYTRSAYRTPLPIRWHRLSRNLVAEATQSALCCIAVGAIHVCVRDTCALTAHRNAAGQALFRAAGFRPTIIEMTLSRTARLLPENSRTLEAIFPCKMFHVYAYPGKCEN